MAVLLMILLMISPISCVLMVYREHKIEQKLQGFDSLLSKQTKSLNDLKDCLSSNDKSIPNVKIESV